MPHNAMFLLTASIDPSASPSWLQIGIVWGGFVKDLCCLGLTPIDSDLIGLRWVGPWEKGSHLKIPR